MTIKASSRSQDFNKVDNIASESDSYSDIYVNRLQPSIRSRRYIFRIEARTSHAYYYIIDFSRSILKGTLLILLLEKQKQIRTCF